MLKKNTSDIPYHIDQLTDFSDNDFFGLIKSILPTFPASIYVKDKFGHYVWCNAYQLKMAGLSHLKDIQGKTDYQLPWRKTADDIVGLDRKVLQSKQLIVTEEHASLYNGRNAVFLTKKIPWFKNENQQEPDGIAGISIDISDIKLMGNESKMQFIKNIQHNIHVPMLGLLHTLSMLIDKEKKPSKKEVVQLALDSAKELMSFLNSVLTFERAQCNPPILIKPFRLLDVFQSVYYLHLAAAHAKNLKFHYKIDPNIPQIVLCDKFRIKHILLNLISNAIKFTTEGKVFFEAKLINTDGGNLLLKFVVKGTGVGSSQDKQDIIFEECICLEPSKIDFAKGFGFGLTNIKTYLKELEGEFKPIKSKEGQGTHFSFLIPMKAPFNQDINVKSFLEEKHIQENNFNRDLNHSTQHKNPQKKSISPCYQKMQLKTLIIEDSRLAQRMTESMLLDLGCDVDLASTADEGLEMLTKNTYHIIFLDLGLPGMSGIEMAKKIRQHEKKWGNPPMPIIGQSAQVDAENKKTCLHAGMNELLSKPLAAGIMIKLLNKYVTYQEKTTSPAKKTKEKCITGRHVIDKTLFNAITHNDPETQARFIALTKQLLITDLIDFKQTYHQQDWKQLLFFTHKLRGSFACIAATRLEEIFGYLEEYLCENKILDIEKLESFYNAISMETKALQKEIDTLNF